MVDRSVVFRDQLKDYLAEAHDSLFAPIEQKIDVAIEKVCLRNDLAYALDTDKASYRFMNPNFSVKITDLIIQEVISPKPLTLRPVVETPAEENIPAAIEKAVEVVAEETETVEVAESETPVEGEDIIIVEE